MASKKHPYCLTVGKLNRRITIETPTTPTDGETNPTYAVLAGNLAAEVMETTGGEYVRGRQIEAGIAAVIRIRWRSDITPVMRVRYGTRYLNILSAIDRTGTRSELEITCKEVQP